MPRLVKNFAQVDGPIWATLFEDGSLLFEMRNEEPNVVWSFGDRFELSPEGVKVLLDVLDAQQGMQRTIESEHAPWCATRTGDICDCGGYKPRSR
jgi:hypothetical protein